MKLIKLIWDFRGPAALQTAKHHVIHLKEYAAAQHLATPVCEHQEITDMHTVAFLVVTEQEMPAVRDALKPHRGTLYQEK